MTEAFHTERQQAAWWVHAVVLACAVGSVAGAITAPADESRWWIVVPVLLLIGIYGLFTPMTVEVSSEEMAVRFGRFGWPGWSFLPAEIEEAQVVTFRPLRDFGGWGIRRGRDAHCLNERGNTGVRFVHAGRAYIIGSDAPEGLLAALRAAGADSGQT